MDNDPEISGLHKDMLKNQKKLIDFMRSADETKENEKKLTEIIKNIHQLQFEIQKKVSLNLLHEKKKFTPEYSREFFNKMVQSICY